MNPPTNSNHSRKGEVKCKGAGNAVLNLAEQVGASPSDTPIQTLKEHEKSCGLCNPNGNQTASDFLKKCQYRILLI